jgi:hypothetical protein
LLFPGTSAAQPKGRPVSPEGLRLLTGTELSDTIKGTDVTVNRDPHATIQVTSRGYIFTLRGFYRLGGRYPKWGKYKIKHEKICLAIMKQGQCVRFYVDHDTNYYIQYGDQNPASLESVRIKKLTPEENLNLERMRF